METVTLRWAYDLGKCLDLMVKHLEDVQARVGRLTMRLNTVEKKRGTYPTIENVGRGHND